MPPKKVNFDKDPECLRISDLRDTTGVYFRRLTAIISSIQLGSPSRIYVTDLTSNPLIVSTYIGSFEEINGTDLRLTSDQLLQVIAYDEKLLPILDKLNKDRNLDLFANETHWKTNLIKDGVFIKLNLKMKKFGSTLEGVAQRIELIDRVNLDLNLPIYTNLLKALPDSFIRYNFKRFNETLPTEFIEKFIKRKEPLIASSPDTFKTPTNRTQTNHVRTPLSPTPQIKLSSIPDLPTDLNHDSDYTPISPQLQVDASFLTQQLTHTHTDTLPKRKRLKSSSQSIQDLNRIEEVDGKIYDVSGVIVEFEPLLNQLCVKTDLNKPPILAPITILISSTNLKSSKEMDESSILRITISSKVEIFKFLDMNEIELIYIKSNEIYEKFYQILKKRKTFEFKVLRRLIKINNDENYVLGWEPVDLTLQKLTHS